MGELNESPAAVGQFCRDPEVVRLVFGGRLDKAALDALADIIKADLDSVSRRSQLHSLRLQKAMDRLSKLMSTLSNVLKEVSAHGTVDRCQHDVARPAPRSVLVALAVPHSNVAWTRPCMTGHARARGWQ